MIAHDTARRRDRDGSRNEGTLMKPSLMLALQEQAEQRPQMPAFHFGPGALRGLPPKPIGWLRASTSVAVAKVTLSRCA
jgi:hypothetical protein